MPISSGASPINGLALQGPDAEAPALPLGENEVMSFKERLASFATEVNHLQLAADKASSQMALGDVRSMHAVMIASEEASLALSTAIQLRNKATEAYQEIMRIQV